MEGWEPPETFTRIPKEGSAKGTCTIRGIRPALYVRLSSRAPDPARAIGRACIQRNFLNRHADALGPSGLRAGRAAIRTSARLRGSIVSLRKSAAHASEGLGAVMAPRPSACLFNRLTWAEL